MRNREFFRILLDTTRETKVSPGIFELIKETLFSFPDDFFAEDDQQIRTRVIGELARLDLFDNEDYYSKDTFLRRCGKRVLKMIQSERMRRGSHNEGIGRADSLADE